MIVPIFLHGGVIHILINLLLQLRLGADMEKAIGTIRFMIIYFPSGIMGFILGANFAGDGIASTGCSGSLFGIIAVVLLVTPFTLIRLSNGTGSIIQLEDLQKPKTTTCNHPNSSTDLFRIRITPWSR